MLRTRLLCVLSSSLCAASAPSAAACSQLPSSPRDASWLLAECGGEGALVHHADGRLYLTELADGESAFLANGNQPEFSPDGARIAWIDGTKAKGRLRRGDPTVYVIARDVEPTAGVHWLANDAVALVLRRDGRKEWTRVDLEGNTEALPELTALGTGGYECDVKLGADGVWSYVAKVTWKTSDGQSGKVPGTCSVSLSPDGRTVTSLHNPHKRCDLTAIRPRGIESVLMWEYEGGFDNHRFASHDPRFVVAVDEHTQTMVVMTLDGARCARVGTLGHADHGMYGDWASGPPRAGAWFEAAAPAGADEAWPREEDQAVFLWDHGEASNTLSTRPPAESLCRLVLHGEARLGEHFGLILTGGGARSEPAVARAAAADLARARAGTLELSLRPASDETDGPILRLVDADAGLLLGLMQRAARVELVLRTPTGLARFDARGVRAGTATHLVASWDAAGLRIYRDGRAVRDEPWAEPPRWNTDAATLSLGASGDGKGSWAGRVEGLALFRTALDAADARAHAHLRERRRAGRRTTPRTRVEATLVQKRALPEPSLYPQTLVAYDYRLESALPAAAGGSETPPGSVVSVVHWGILDGTVQRSVRDRTLAARYALQLEPWDAHPELQRFKLVADELARGVSWFDATPPAAEAALPAR